MQLLQVGRQPSQRILRRRHVPQELASAVRGIEVRRVEGHCDDLGKGGRVELGLFRAKVLWW